MREMIVGEIEGDRARLARVLADPGGGFEICDQVRFERGETKNFEAEFARFVERAPNPVGEAALAVGGPIEGGNVRLTKESFMVSARHLKRAHNFTRVTLLNDSAATARGAVETPDAGFLQIAPGAGDANSSVVVVHPGIGLGMAITRKIGGRWMAFESEGGHQSYAPLDDDEIALLREHLKTQNYFSYEDVISEGGVLATYRAFSRIANTPATLQNFNAVIEAGCKRTSRSAVLACEVAARSLATFAGNACLSAAARGGVILAGAVARALEPFLVGEMFVNRFRRRGAMTLYVADVPIRLLRDDAASLRGLAAHCVAAEV
jgi:glucokinase